MTAAPGVHVDHRQRVLRALGVVAYGLRGRCIPGWAAESVQALPESPSGMPGVTCVLVLPEGASARECAQVDRIMQALGDAFARAPQVTVVAGELTEPVPPARAYLVFGEAQARALGRHLPAAVMADAEVLLLDTPDGLFQSAGKRRLWQALGGLRRQWRATAGGGE